MSLNRMEYYEYLIFIVLVLIIISLLIILLMNLDKRLIKRILYIYIMSILYKYITCNYKNFVKIYKNKTIIRKYIIVKSITSIKNTCNICYEDIDIDIYIDIYIDSDVKNLIMSFACCKFNNKICLNCVLKYYKSKKLINSIYNYFNCPFCNQPIYLLQLTPNIIYRILNYK